ncbi:MAG: hypothetical protein BWY72_02335 [Bacteroidetes bacterium ADurb.Bin416]|nr:MAG: hypothetical protein BWY72_02335 [Bacteroidetes bacterium ADurb.Bin416]
MEASMGLRKMLAPSLGRCFEPYMKLMFDSTLKVLENLISELNRVLKREKSVFLMIPSCLR